MASRRCIVCEGAGPFRNVYERGGHRLVRCPSCGLVFQDPQPSDEVLDASYYHDPGFTRALAGPLREITLERARAKLPLVRAAGAGQRGDRLLDVGCSSGAWLEVAAGAGMMGTGVEVGDTTAEEARRRGLDVRTGTLEEARAGLARQRFDLVTFWDVLEHLRDPRRELALARELLAPGGVVAATFPNVEGWYPRATHALLARRTGVWEYPELPVHLYDFGPATARALLEREGYRLTAVRTLPTPFRFYRETALSPDVLGRSVRAWALRGAFEALRLAVYPLARLADRQNTLFVAATPAPQHAGSTLSAVVPTDGEASG